MTKRKFNHDELCKNRKYSECENISEYLEKGEITSKVLSECCMPKSSQYHVQYVNKNDVISLYREVKSKIPTKIKKIIYYLINPTFSYWVDKCVESFIEIIVLVLLILT